MAICHGQKTIFFSYISVSQALRILFFISSRIGIVCLFPGLNMTSSVVYSFILLYQLDSGIFQPS